MRFLWVLALVFPLHSQAVNLWGDEGCQAYLKVFQWLELAPQEITPDQHLMIGMAMMRQCSETEAKDAAQCQQIMRKNFSEGCADLKAPDHGTAGTIKTR